MPSDRSKCRINFRHGLITNEMSNISGVAFNHVSKFSQVCSKVSYQLCEYVHLFSHIECVLLIEK